MSNVAIFGVSGLCGSNLLKTLSKDPSINKIVGITRDFDNTKVNFINDVSKKLIWCRGNITDYKFVDSVISKYDVNYIYHLAAISTVQSAEASVLRTLETNVQGTWNIMEAARNNKSVINTVVSTSDKVYGHLKELPYIESSLKYNPIGTYETSKTMADLCVQMYGKNFGVSCSVFRSCNMFGPYDMNMKRLVPYVILETLNGRSPIIRRTSCIREFIFVDHVVNNIIELSKYQLKGEAFNMASGYICSVGDFVCDIIDRINLDLKPEFNDNQGDDVEIDKQYLEGSKLVNQLGNKFSSLTVDKFDECLDKTIDFYRWYDKWIKK